MAIDPTAPPPDAAPAGRARTYAQLFGSFFGIGFFTLGGGYAMLPLIEREVVGRRRWLGGDEYVDMLALAQVLPGPVALNTAVFVGQRRAGFGGACAAAAGIVSPALFAMLALAMFLLGFRSSPAVERVFFGLRPAVVALIVATLPDLAKKAKLRGRALAAAAAVAAVVAQPWWPVSPAYVVVAVVAWALLLWRPTPPTVPAHEDIPATTGPIIEEDDGVRRAAHRPLRGPAGGGGSGDARCARVTASHGGAYCAPPTPATNVPLDHAEPPPPLPGGGPC